MADSTSMTIEPTRRFQPGWITGVLFRPRRVFEAIAAQAHGTWLTPMILLTLTALAQVLIAGWLKQQAALIAGPTLPPDFQYYSPEMQAQFMQAAQATSGPVFVYVFPAVIALGGVWIGWLLVSGLLHLVVTLLGGRGDTGYAFNLVAWCSLPFAIRDLVRAGAMLASRQLISSPGLSGFAAQDPGGEATYLAALLSLVDIYLLWHILLLIVGVRVGNNLSASKAVGGVIFTIVLVTTLQSLLSYGVDRLGALTVVRPFF